MLLESCYYYYGRAVPIIALYGEGSLDYRLSPVAAAWSYMLIRDHKIGVRKEDWLDSDGKVMRIPDAT